jgi:hypothetical protein
MVDIELEDAHWTSQTLEVTFRDGKSPFGEWTVARCYGNAGWEVLMGSSWEEWYTYNERDEDALREIAEIAHLRAGPKPIALNSEENFSLRILLRHLQKKAQDEGEDLSPTWASILKKLEEAK